MIKVFTGSNNYLKIQGVRALIEDFKASQGDLSIEQFEGDQLDLATLISFMDGGSLFSSQKLIIIKELSNNKQLSEQIDKIIEIDHEYTTLLVVETKLDKRGVLYKTLKSKKLIEEFEQLDEYALTNWVVGTAKLDSSEISQQDARYLIDRVGSNQDLLWNELQKLSLYGPITKQSIDLLTTTTPSATVFELLDAAFSGNKKKTAALYAELRMQRIEPEAIMPLLSWQLHVLAVIASTTKSSDEISQGSSISPYTLRKNLPLARTIGIQRIKIAVAKATKLDADFKSRAINKEEALLELLLSI